jgi:hypothetical protein
MSKLCCGREFDADSELSPFDIVITIGVNILNKSICVLIKGIVSTLTIKFWMCQKCGKMNNYKKKKKEEEEKTTSAVE